MFVFPGLSDCARHLKSWVAHSSSLVRCSRSSRTFCRSNIATRCLTYSIASRRLTIRTSSRFLSRKLERLRLKFLIHSSLVPIATASIGQVHVAYLDGRKVAVKVQRPNVEIDFAGDIRLMAAAITLIKRLRVRSLYWMLEPTGEFLTWTHEELDYRYEARYMERLRRNALNNPRERVPEVFWPYTTRRTLVCEFFEGDTMLAYLRAHESGDEQLVSALKTTGFEPDRTARNIIDNFLGDVFQHGMFHADLHPANLMILPGNTVGLHRLRHYRNDQQVFAP